MQSPDQNRPKLGLALSGAAIRASFYIGFLEVMDEHRIPIDYISACSSGTIVAAAYACGALPQFKEQILNMEKKHFMESLATRAERGGLYNMDLMEEWLRQFTGYKVFEEVRPHMSFIAADIDRGEQVVLSMGDIARAARIACTIPGIFEPLTWGGRVLVDGGLFNFVPVDILKQVGMDISVGINLRDDRHRILRHKQAFNRMFKAMERVFFINHAGRLWQQIRTLLERTDIIGYYGDMDRVPSSAFKGMFSIIGKSLDLAMSHKPDHYLELVNPMTDLIIYPVVPKVGWLAFEKTEEIYKMGRQNALQNLPKIKHLLQTVSVKEQQTLIRL